MISRWIKSNCCDAPVESVRSVLTEEVWLYCTSKKCKDIVLACTKWEEV